MLQVVPKVKDVILDVIVDAEKSEETILTMVTGGRVCPDSFPVHVRQCTSVRIPTTEAYRSAGALRYRS